MSRAWSYVLIGVCLAVLGLGLTRLFQLRFSRGDLYPAYSTLRSDPLGGRVLYEALLATDIAVRRNFREIKRASWPVATIYVPGVTPQWFESEREDDWQPLLSAVEQGARLIVTFAPQTGQGDDSERPGLRAMADEDDEEEEKKKDVSGQRLLAVLEAGPEWTDRLTADENRRAARARAAEPTALPDSLPWRTTFGIDPQADAWRTVYQVGTTPVVVERPWGEGTIVLLGNAFLLSNEAMAHAREPALLTWLQGAHPIAVFDESHLGVRENPGVATLARRYGLEHTALALLLVAILFIWRNGTSLVPRQPEDDTTAETTNELTGRDSATGLLNLLQRAVNARTLFPVCVSEYRRSNAWRRLTPRERESFDHLVQTQQQDHPLQSMRAVHAALDRRHHKSLKQS